MRTPDFAGYETPATSVVLVETNCRWLVRNLLGHCTLQLNIVMVQEGADVIFMQEHGQYSGTRANIIAGSFDLADGARLRVTSNYLLYQPCLLIGHLAATVSGTGAIDMSNTADSGDLSSDAQFFTPRITGDLSGFKGDLRAYNAAKNGATSLALRIANAVSNPGDPDPGCTAYVVVTNGGTLIVDHDWVSPVNRVWNFGDGTKPTINVAAGQTLTINGELVGPAGFVKAGEGTLVLTSASQSFTGDCNVLSGKVRLEGAANSLTRCFRPKKKLAVPSGYTKLEYLSLAGGAQDSYIDTGYTPTSAFGCFFDYMPNVAIVQSTGSRVMGSSFRNGGKWGGILLSNWVDRGTDYTGQLAFGDRTVNFPANGGQAAFTRMRLSLMGGQAELNRGWKTPFATGEVNPANFGGSVYVGNVHCDTMAAGAPTSVYRYKIFESERLLHDFVPVTRASDGAVGLYDTYGNLGFRPAAGAAYVSAGPAYSGSDDEWLEVAPPAGTFILVQ